MYLCYPTDHAQQRAVAAASRPAARDHHLGAADVGVGVQGEM